jgi:hypothetical protein
MTLISSSWDCGIAVQVALNKFSRITEGDEFGQECKMGF